MADKEKKQKMTIEEIIEEWREAKRMEDKYKELRLDLVDEIVEILGCPDEGGKTHKVGKFKVTVKGTINRTCDWELYDLLFMRNPRKHMPHINKRSLDPKGVRYYQDNEPDFYRSLAECITAKPGQIGVSVK